MILNFLFAVIVKMNLQDFEVENFLKEVEGNFGGEVG